MPKRKYADLHLIVSDDGDPPELLLKMARHLGFSLVALSTSNPLKVKMLSDIKRLGSEVGVDVAFRLDLHTSSVGELKRYLRKFRRDFEIISVNCLNVAVARLAARDRRVDITYYNPDNILSILDEGQITLLSESGHCVEVNLLDFLHEPSDRQARMLWNCRLALKRVLRKKIPIIFSSGASRILDMRAPRELASIAFILLDDEALARESVSSIPQAIVKNNREKLSQHYVQPGVKVVEEW